MTTTPATHPGYYVQYLMDKYKVTTKELAKQIFCPLYVLEAILKGDQRLAPFIIAGLAEVFPVSKAVWEAKQLAYDEAIKKLVATQKEEQRLFFRDKNMNYTEAGLRHLKELDRQQEEQEG